MRFQLRKIDKTQKVWFRRLLLLFLLILSLFLLIFRPYEAKASPPIATGSNFNLYFTSGSAMQFQHLKVGGGMVPFTAKVNVDSGTLNGTNGNIEMYLTWGKLSFTSQDNATLTPSPSDDVAIIVNDKELSDTASISPGDSVIIIWSMPAYEPFLPILFIFGMFGLLAMFIGPAYAIQKIKKADYREAFVTGFLVTFIGITFFMMWLSG